jgi:hypothetical protein
LGFRHNAEGLSRIESLSASPLEKVRRDSVGGGSVEAETISALDAPGSKVNNELNAYSYEKNQTIPNSRVYPD